MLNIWDNGRRNLCVHLVTKLVLSYTIWYGLFGNDEVGGPNPPSSSTAKAPRSLTAGLFSLSKNSPNWGVFGIMGGERMCVCVGGVKRWTNGEKTRGEMW